MQIKTWVRLTLMGVTLFMGACAHKQASLPANTPGNNPVANAPVVPAAPEHVPPTPDLLSAAVSNAHSPREYRKDAARHLYQHYQTRIYKGKMPPMLKAVGVLEVSVNSRGQVDEIVWLRAPRHVPEVMREIENAIRAAQPYPAPLHLKHVKYTDTWLWHASGQFQLDTLTEGQY
jgi:hypothetical protein